MSRSGWPCSRIGLALFTASTAVAPLAWGAEASTIGIAFSSTRAMPRAAGSLDLSSSARGQFLPVLGPSLPGTALGWSQMAGDDTSSASAVRSRNLKSIGLSVLLPGLAQYQMGHKLRAAAYFTAEAALWSAFAGYRIQGSQREDSYIQMAELFAGVDDAHRLSDEYYKLLAGWPSSDLYNEIVVRREARTRHGDDLEERAAYYEENKIQGDEMWTWVSNAARERYQVKRSDAKRSYKYSRNMIGLAVANRVVAMIDAVLLERKQANLRVELAPDPRARGARFAVSRELP